MENVTTFDWIFAGIFLVGFIIFLVWSYRKDLKLHKVQYKGTSIYVLGVIILVLFVFYVLKQFFT